MRKVIHNEDGDLLFSCSDDGKVAVYDTYQCVRTGLFDVGSASVSIDVTRDSKHLLSTNIDGIVIFNVKDGSVAAKLALEGNIKVQVKLAYGDKQFLVIFQSKKITYVHIYDLNAVLAAGTSGNTPKPVKEIVAKDQAEFTCATWGPLNKCFYAATKTGRVHIIDTSSGVTLKDVQIHPTIIYELKMSHDYTMLFTASRDGTSQLLHPETFETIREFNFGKYCRSVAISPLHDSQEF